MARPGALIDNSAVLNKLCYMYSRGRPKKRRMDCEKDDLAKKGVSEAMTADRRK